MNTTKLHTQTAVVAVPASGPGALAGFESVCSCGLQMRSSLEVNVILDKAQHARWHESQGTCMHRQVRRHQLQDLFCKRSTGHPGNHLHDAHPAGARWVNGQWIYG